MIFKSASYHITHVSKKRGHRLHEQECLLFSEVLKRFAVDIV